MSACPDEAAIAAVVDGSADEALRARVLEHCEACADCAALVGSLVVLERPAGASDEHEGARYAIERELGAGAMGVVYVARDAKLDRLVALKLLKDPGPDERARVLREARAMAKLAHPNVVRVHDVVDGPARVGLSMELIVGEPLDALIAREERFTPERLRALALDVARALAAAHAAGVVHRDLKPSNVILREEGGAVVTDFGVARAHAPGGAANDDRVRITIEGALIGTPLYMAPEQLAGSTAVGPPADVYAFGLLVTEVATGSVPLSADTVAALRLRRATEEAPSLRAARPDLGALAVVVDRCLARDPSRRFPDGRALVRALEAAPPASRARVVIAAGAALAIAFGAATLGGRARPAPSPLPASPDAAPVASARPFMLAPTNYRRVTFDEGCEEYPVFSPDGRRLYYDAVQGDDANVAERDLDTDAVRWITRGSGWSFAPDVSPDGASVAYLRWRGTAIDAVLQPIDGSAAPRAIGKGSLRPHFTPDGKALWVGSTSKAERVDLASGAVTATLASDDLKLVRLLELDDGALWRTGCLRAGLPGSCVLERRAPGAAAFERVWQGEVFDGLDRYGDRVLFGDYGAAHEPALLAAPVAGGAPERLSTSVAPLAGVRVSRDRKRIAWSTCESKGELAVVENGRMRTAFGTSAWGGLDAAPLSDHSVVVVSARSNAPDAWIFDTRKGGPPPRALRLGALVPHHVAALGEGVVLATDKGLYAAALDGAAPRALTSDPSDALPTARRGDKEVFFTRGTNTARVLAVDVATGAVRDPNVGVGSWPAASPAADLLVFLEGADPTVLVPRVVDLGTGARRPLAKDLAPGAYKHVSFAPDGRTVLLDEGDQQILEIVVATGAVVRRWSATGGDQLLKAFRVGAETVFVRLRFDGDVWVADLP